ncbi:hypothetical protein FNV43_RR18736 [Rhamnella rubrinervis]|uniref:B3 domain-containing protein n=1 Tax=Rhamnella rubrinervis TaxID=2594499 RepID=A0A8K0EBF2_9ROSA|nr:hypothetical protein FNV43_RR18736 [Rhamnella rubrinervis]
MEDWSGLHLLAEVCAQEQRALSSALVPVKFPKKRRSSLLLIKNETDFTTGRRLKLKISPTLLGKRCYFQLDNGHIGDQIGDGGSVSGACGVDYKGNKKQTVTATIDPFASSSSGGDVDGHSFTLSGTSHVNGDDNMENKKQIVTARNFAPFASCSSSVGVDSRGSGVDYNGKKKQIVTDTFSSFASTRSIDLDGDVNEVRGVDYTRKNKQIVTDSTYFASNSAAVDGHGNWVCGVDYTRKNKQIVTDCSDFASNSAAVDGHGNWVCGVDYTRKNKQIVSDSSDFASTSSSALDGHGNEVCGVDYTRKSKQIVTDSTDFASSSSVGGIDGHGNWVCGVGNRGKKTQRITFTLSGGSKFDGEGNLGKKIRNQNITATPSATSQQEEAPSTLSSTSGLNLPLSPQFRFHLEYPNLPTRFVNRIQAMGGSKVMLVIEKNLFKTDLDKGHNRLSIPCSQIKNEFLSQEEKMALRTMQSDGKHHQGMDVPVIEPCLDLSTLCLKKWDFNSSSSYVLIKNWNNVADKNNLKLKMTVQLWSFRINTALCFALVNLSQQ